MRLKLQKVLLLFVVGAGLAAAQRSNWTQLIQYDLQQKFKDDYYLQSLTYTAKFCINMTWVQLTIIETKKGQNVNIQSTQKNLQKPCTPSNDENDNPLPNDETTTTKEWSPIEGPPPPPPLSEIEKWSQQNGPLSIPRNPEPRPQPAATAQSGSNLGFTLVAPYRDVLFPPYYDPSVTPSPPGCNPTASTTSLIVNHADAAVTVVASCSGAPLASVPVTTNPLQVALTPDGTMALVTSFDGALTFINMSTYAVAYTLNLSAYFPSGLAISPDGSTAYVTSFDQATASLLEISVQNPSVLRTIPLTGYPQSVYLTPDGAIAYVTDPINGGLTVLDLLSGTVSRQLSLNRPIGVAFNAQATQAWITTGSGVLVLNTATYQTIQTIQTDAGPSDILITPDNGIVLVNNFGGQSFSIIDPVTFDVQTFPVGGPPMGLTLVQ